MTDAVRQAYDHALAQALTLARTTRADELRGGRRPKLLDDRGLHPFSLELGRAYALADLLGETTPDVNVLRRTAADQAEFEFVEAVKDRGMEAYR